MRAPGRGGAAAAGPAECCCPAGLPAAVWCQGSLFLLLSSVFFSGEVELCTACACVLGRVHLFVTPWAVSVALQAPLSVPGVFFPDRNILEGVAISFSRGSSQPGIEFVSPAFGRWILYHLKVVV